MKSAIFRIVKTIGAGLLGAFTTGLISGDKTVKENLTVGGSIAVGGIISGAAKLLRTKNPDHPIWKYLKI
jgi:hypothetical protein